MTKRAPLPRWLDLLARAGITLVAMAFLFLLRPDLLLSVRGYYQQYLGTPLMIRAYLRDHPERKLNLGAGPDAKQGWLNTDIDMLRDNVLDLAYLDAGERFPFPDKSFDFIYSEHLIEHLTLDKAILMLRESRRVLKPGGRIRVATPDLHVYLKLFEASTPEREDFIAKKLKFTGWPKTPDPECVILNLSLHDWGHQFVYTPKMLRFVLEHEGFRDVTAHQVGESGVPQFRKIESRASWDDGGLNARETMIFEAVRQ
jgi:SAM-dependent methyltransferase